MTKKKLGDLCDAILETSCHAIAVFRPASGKIVYNNRPFSNLVGVSSQKVADNTFYYYLGEKSKAKIGDVLEPLLSGGEKSVTVNLVVEVPLRPTRNIEAVFTLPVESDTRPLVCVTIRDITEFRQRYDLLQRRLHRLDRVVDGSPESILVTDMEGLIRFANKGACKLLGYSSEELQRQKYVQDLLDGDADREIMERLRESDYGGPGILDRYSAICISKIRQRIAVWVSVHILHGLKGEEIGLAFFITDMRDVTEMERKLEEVQLQLIHADKMASLGKLAAGVAHEINNPLGGILLFGGLLLEDMDFSDPKREDMTRIVQEARRCKEIVNSLLDFAHQRKRYREVVDLAAAVEQCLSLLGNNEVFHNIEFVTHLAPSLPTVTGNPSQIKQVFTNLITNAVDAMDGEGKLEIVSFHDERANEVGVRFCDTGPGVPPEVQARIFDPFFTTKEPGKGTGLGLSLSYNIIRMHHGDIRLRNMPGGGAEFTVVFPVSEEEEI